MGMKARGLKGGNGGGSNVDWSAINDQVDEGTQSARISVIVDLGMHQEEKNLSEKGQTGFMSQEDAEDYLDEMKKAYPKHSVFKKGDPDIDEADDVELGKFVKTLERNKKGEWEVVDEDPEWVVAFNEYGGVDKNGNPKFYNELAIFADLVDNDVDYGEEIGTKQYRLMLNRRWMGKLVGFQLKPTPPVKGDIWTIRGNTKLAEIAEATGHKDLLEVNLEDADWSEMLGEGLNIAVEKTGEDGQYIEVGKCVGLKKDRKTKEVEEVTELDTPAVLITFDDCTLEDLERAHLRVDVINKIKQADDYEGSQIQKAIEIGRASCRERVS